MNISQLWKLYEADKRIQGFSIQTLKAYALQLKMLVNELGDIHISDVILQLLKEYLTKQSDRLKPSSFYHENIMTFDRNDSDLEFCITINSLGDQASTDFTRIIPGGDYITALYCGTPSFRSKSIDPIVAIGFIFILSTKSIRRIK
ncbi:hypothetical protein LOZ80_28745 [Paenibacillus sp. HWE-109]|uniref:hypothetical protein n=1 Tax=Paenibacillus sp. HWE-109 TaxID=1306526 RepID=UPI001EDFC6EF|nr:hypothetical protein [Paenibacillus sp. HWE-109]UKS25544.1 hypothetical protein LOZ80_28745 [Paenibacillus sp. HWE-109]